MKISNAIALNGKSISFEFFPPKNAEGERQLFETVSRLEGFEPTFVSVTYGAGGGTRDNTVRTVKRIATETSLTVMPHLTCVNQSEEEIRNMLDGYKELGVENVLALRGDPPQGVPTTYKDGLCHAGDLVRLVASYDRFSIGVAVYPEGHLETPDPDLELEYTKQKVDAGADFAITQMFFDNRYYYSFVERAEKIGIHIPIIPGIMPITDVARIKKFSQTCGTTLPGRLIGTMEEAASPEDVRKLGIEYATKQAEDLLRNGFKYLHFYTLNRPEVVTEVLCNLSLTRDSRVCVAA